MMYYLGRYLLWTMLATAVLGCGYYVEGCVEEERFALLAIKSYMLSFDDSSETIQIPWYNSSETNNCCHWLGVRCNHSTGRVTELDFNGKVSTTKYWLFNVTLFRPFRQLISLDLSRNDLYGLVEHDGSTKISTLKNLQVLKLDWNDITPGYLSVSVLTSLKRLDLSAALYVEDLSSSLLSLSSSLLSQTELPSLTGLQALDLSNNVISSGIQGICKLKNLVELDLAHNRLDGVLPNCLANLSSLQILDISNNNFSGKLPNFLFSNFKSLQSLNITDNFFEGKFFMTLLDKLSNLTKLQLSGNMLEVQFGGSSWRPKFQLHHLGLRSCNLSITSETFLEFWSHQTNLSELDLSYNNLHMDFPAWLFGRKSKLRALHLANNSIMGNLSLPHHSTILPLEVLDIPNNHFHGQLPQSIGHVFPHLQYLNLSRNHFEGPIPTSITLIKGLNYLDLSFNSFSGKLPTKLFSDCNSIRVLQLSDNNLEGDIIPEDMTLPDLVWLKLSNNRFGGTIKESLLKSPRLYYLDMSNNSITGHLPQWIGNFSDLLLSLSISQNNLQGEIPKEIICKLAFLDLSHNYLSGSIPTCSNSCHYSQLLHLHSNNLSGVIPNTLSRCSALQTLNLRDNHLSGGIPSWIHKLSELKVLMLSRNHLHGPIPPQLCQISGINILDLSYNNLSGEIPSCIANLSFGMKIATFIGNNHFLLFMSQWYTDIMQFRMEFYVKPEELEFLNKNQLLDYRGRILVMMSLLDLSSNNLTGHIPLQLSKLAQLYALNLSHNFLSGSIPSHFSNLTQVESLDLSFNHLSGQIPSQLVELYSLEIFNVSYNNLSGRVPKTGQFASFDERNYYGNPRLYGYNPVKALPPETPPKEDEDEDEDGGDHWGIIDMIDFLWSFSMSWVTMFFATILILYINLQWRGAVFDFVDSRILCWFTKFKLNI